MGILNKKENIVDLVLTDKGREQMAKNNLNFTFYSFSDDGIDYSGSLSSSVEKNMSLDNYIHQNISFEAVQHSSGKRNLEGKLLKRRGFSPNSDLKYFLYTIPPYVKEAPKFISNLDLVNNALSMSRNYYNDELILNGKKINRIKKPEAIILKASVLKKTLKDKLIDYVNEQHISNTKERLEEGKNIAGRVIAKNFIALDNLEAINITTGEIENIDTLLQSNEQELFFQEVVSFKKEVEIVAGLDPAVLEFKLKTSVGEVSTNNGFLVEIFESGSDGFLTKLVEEDVINPINDNEIEKGFQNFLELDIDINE